MKKLLFIAIAVVVVIIIALTLFIKVYITPEKVKAFLIPEAEKSLNRKVTIDDINISLFKGIEVKNLSIKEIDGKTDFLKSKDFVLKYKFLPLLSKNVIVDELKILSPEIRIVRYRDGKFNFEDIGKQRPADEIKEEKEPIEATSLPVSLLISKLIIKDASFSFIDNKKELPDIKGSVNVSAAIKSSGRSEILSEGNISLKVDELAIKNPSKRHIKNIAAGLKYIVNINVESNDIRINKADIKIQKIPASITGDVINIKTSPEIDIAISIPETKAAAIQELIAQFFDLKGATLSGELLSNLRLKGKPKKPASLKTDGKITFKKVGINYNNVNVILDGNLKLYEQSMNVDLRGAIGKNTADLKGSVSNYFKNQKVKLNLYSKKLYLDELIPTGAARVSSPDKEAEKSTQEKSKMEEAKPLNLGLTAEGEIKIDTASYKGMNMSNFYMRYMFGNNRFKILKMNALVGKGEFSLKSLVDFSKQGYTYSLSTSLESLHANEVVNSFFPKAKDTVFGILSSTFQLNGAGTLPENIKKNLIANGDFSIIDGKITNSKLPEKLAQFLGIDELRTINIKQAKGTVKIRNGIAKLNSIFSSDDISVNPSGNIGLDETLNLTLDLKLSPRLTDKAMLNSSIASYIKDEAGWGRIPLKVSGTFSDPSYSVDIAKAGKRVIKKKTKKLIEDIFDEDKDKTKEKGKQQKDKKPFEDVLKGLF